MLNRRLEAFFGPQLRAARAGTLCRGLQLGAAGAGTLCRGLQSGAAGAGTLCGGLQSGLLEQGGIVGACNWGLLEQWAFVGSCKGRPLRLERIGGGGRAWPGGREFLAGRCLPSPTVHGATWGGGECLFLTDLISRQDKDASLEV